MKYNPKPNSGYLWPNPKKMSDKHPDFRGNSVIDKQLLKDLLAKDEDPVPIEVSAWDSVGNQGQRYFYLRFSEPFVPQKKLEEPAPKAAPEDDEDVPF